MLPESEGQRVGLLQNLIAYIKEQVEQGILTPGMRDIEIIRLNHAPGRAGADLAKCLTQFITFSQTAWHKSAYRIANISGVRG